MDDEGTTAGPIARRALLAGVVAGAVARPALLRAQSETRLRLAHALPSSHPVHAAMEGMVAEIEARSGGAIRVALFANGELGDEVELMENARTGALDLVKLSASVVERVVPAYRVFNLPFLFRDRGHFQSVATGEVGEAFLASGTASGLVGLTLYDAGSRSFYAQKPIDRPEDLAGLKIRIQPSPTMSRMIALFGAEAVPLPWQVVYSALQTGLVDGAENSVAALIVGRHGEVARYYSFDEHTMVPDVLMMSARRWNDLSAPHREIVTAAARHSFARMSDLWTAFEEESLRRARSMGIAFTRPDKRGFIERAAPLRADFADDSLVLDLVGRVERVA